MLSPSQLSSDQSAQQTTTRENVRKRTINSIQTKYFAILEVEKGLKSKTAISRDFDIPSNTLSTWLKHAEKIKRVYQQGCFQPGRKRMRFGDYEDVDNALFNWFLIQRDANVSLNGQMIIKKARELADEFGYSGFKCSNGWLDRFKDRHGISLRRSDDCVTHDFENEDWGGCISSLLIEYHHENIFSTVETGLLYRLLPNQLHEVRDAIHQGRVKSEEKLTILTCYNISGSEQLPLLVLGTAPKLECSKVLNSLPLQYETNKKSLITPIAFTKWLRNMDGRFKIQNRKVAMIVKRCTAQYFVKGLEAIKVIIVPDDICRPDGPAIVHNLKMNYRTGLILQQNNASEKRTEFKVTLSDTLNLLQTAWDNVSQSSIAEIFQNPIPVKKEKENQSSIPLLNVAGGTVYLAGFSLADYIIIDENLATIYSPSEDDDQVEPVSDSRHSNQVDVDEVFSSEAPQDLPEPCHTAAPTKEMALQAYQTLLAYLGNQENGEEVLDDLYSVGKYLIKEEGSG